VGTFSIIFSASEPTGRRPHHKELLVQIDLPPSPASTLQKGHVPPDIYVAAKEACRHAANLPPAIVGKNMLPTLIVFSIEAGANTQRSIIGAVRSAKAYSTAQIAMALKSAAGPNPEHHRWQVDANGIYSLHPNAL
jgi:hypothetical protein